MVLTAGLTPLTTSRVLFDGSKEAMCLDGSFAKWVNDEKEWPYLLAALRRCNKPDGQAELAIANDAWREISNHLLTSCMDYADYKPVWLMLLGYINRLETQLSPTDTKDLLPPKNCARDHEEQLVDTAMYLNKFNSLERTNIWGISTDEQQYRLETIHHTLRGGGNLANWGFLKDLREHIEGGGGGDRELPDEFRDKFTRKVFERFSGPEYFGDKSMENPILRILLLNYRFFFNDPALLVDIDPNYASEYAKYILFFSLNNAPNPDTMSDMDKNMANRFIVYFLQRCSFELFPDTCLQDTLLKNTNARNSICLSVRSEEMRKNLALIASVPKFKLVYDNFETYLRKNCRIELMEAAQLTGDRIPIIGDMRALRNFELLSEDYRIPVNVLSKLSSRTTLDPSETIFLSNSVGMAKLFQRAEAGQIPALIDAFPFLESIDPDSFKAATRTTAFRNLVLRAFENGKVGSLLILEKLCGATEGYCKSLIESTMSDAVVKGDNKVLTLWIGTITALSVKLADAIPSCTPLTIYECSQEFIKPDLREVIRTMNQLPLPNQLPTMTAVYRWIPQKLLEDRGEPEFVSLMLKVVFRKGDYRRIKSLLEVAPTGFADQDGFAYAAWFVVHAASRPRTTILKLSTADLKTPNIPSMDIPNFKDLCNGRCVVLDSKDQANADLLTNFRKYRGELESSTSVILGGGSNRITLQPLGSNASISDRLVQLWLQEYKLLVNRSADVQEFMEVLIKSYLPSLAAKIKFGEPSITLENLKAVYDHYFERQKATTRGHQLLFSQIASGQNILRRSQPRP